MSELTKIVIETSPLFTGASAVYPYDETVMERLQFTTRFAEDVQLGSRAGDKMLLPRALCPLGKDERSRGYPITLKPQFTPRSEEQVRVVHEAVSLLRKEESFILRADTGFGKTPVGVEIIRQNGRSTLLIVHKEDLLDIWREALMKFGGMAPEQIGLIRQNTCKTAGCPVVIGMVQSLSIEGRYPASIRSQFGLVLMDEVHRMPTENFTKAICLFPAVCRLGMSATPERADGKELVLQSHIGMERVTSTVQTLTPNVFMYETGWKVPMVQVYDPNTGRTFLRQMYHEAGKLGAMLSRMVVDDDRNAMILDGICTAYDKGRKIIVFTERLKHIDVLRHGLIRRGVVASDISKYVGGMKKEERERAKVKPIMLSTFKFGEEGTDIPWLDLCVMATPRAQVKQPIGRILREYPDKKQPAVIDYCDDDSHVMLGYRRSREKFYRKIGAEIMRMN